jgi:hydrogenase maturation factor HypF (carbamoyltransferase family)
VALTGGCFQNRLLAELASAELEALGFEVLSHERVPATTAAGAGAGGVASFRLATAQARGLPCA